MTSHAQRLSSALAIPAVWIAGCLHTPGRPSAVLRPATPIELPGVTQKDPHVGEFDCNNPAHWDGETLYVFSSTGHPWRGGGPDLFHLARPSARVTFDNEKQWVMGGRWIEATHKVESGPLYMWYHNEPHPVCDLNAHLTAPRIGQMVSHDDGLTWHDQGILLEAPGHSNNCATANTYFAGGNGDFSVVLDRRGEYFYFLISTYNRNVDEQGVAVARMRYADRDDPVGKVSKWCRGRWSEPGIGGHVTPIFPARVDWHRPDADAFWGPSIHWNHYLNQYVILLNRAKDKDWAQEGVSVSFNPDVADPTGWSVPEKILDGGAWYPQVIGIDASGKETDKLAGRVARLFVRGRSEWEIEFRKPGT